MMAKTSVHRLAPEGAFLEERRLLLSAINGDHRSIHPTGRRRGHKYHYAGDLLGRAQAAKGKLLPLKLLKALGLLLLHAFPSASGKEHRPRTDGVNTNAQRGQLQRQGLTQKDLGSFGAAILERRRRLGTGDGGNNDNRAFAALLEVGDGGSTDPDSMEEVEVKGAQPLFVRRIEQA